MNALGLFICSFFLAAFAGLAALLRTGTTLTKMALLSWFLNSGFLGLGICLIWYTRYQNDVYYLVGICVLAGLGGMKTVEFGLEVFGRLFANERRG